MGGVGREESGGTADPLKARFPRLRRELEPTRAARLALAYRTQFSAFSAGTRLNSVKLSVTQTASIARACAAISMSCAPIGVLFFPSATRDAGHDIRLARCVDPTSSC